MPNHEMVVWALGIGQNQEPRTRSQDKEPG